LGARIDDITLEVCAGVGLAVVGASGAGKPSFLRQGISLVGPFSVPAHRREIAFSNAFLVEIRITECGFGPPVMLIGSFATPTDSLGVVLRHSFALMKH
jgi:hypothetical protein